MKSVIDKINENYGEADRQLLIRAYRYAEKMHENQKRASGEPYFTHPCAVAEILIDLGLDTPTVAAAFLHDVIEDTAATADDIKREFGGEIYTLVEGVTKLEQIKFHTHEEEDAENFRKIFVAMAKDVRVIIIKLADRLHNMRSLNYLSNERQQRIAKETLGIFTPLADRLGISQVKCELEDLCLKYLEPEAYEYLVTNINQKLDERQKFVDTVVAQLRKMLDDNGIKGDVVGRPKHFYSIYKKMKNKGLTLDQIYDLTAVRVIVDKIETCYEVLGIIHKQWRPVPGRIKDYIATPKRNLYQSLHTTVVTDFGQFFEIQIRTAEMHKMAEYGIAAHWKYKEQRTGAETSFDQRLSWIRDVMDWQGSLETSKEFVDSLKNDLYASELLVFTPQGKVISLPLEATPVDFAYAIHSEVGNKCVGAKVNGKIVPLNGTLKTGDVVEILTSSNSKGPSWDWLKFVKSGSAKAKIKQFFKHAMKEENVRTGKSMLEAEAKRRGYSLADLLTDESFAKLSEKLVFASVDEMMASVGYGAVGVNQIIYKLIDFYRRGQPLQLPKTEVEKLKHTPAGSVSVKGMEGLLVRFAHCCNPVPGDSIVGFVSRGRGVIVHRKDCPNLVDYDADRIQPANWTGDAEQGFLAGIKILADDDAGLTAFITSEISAMQLYMTQINGRVGKDGKAVFQISVKLNKLSDLDLLIKHLKRDRHIIDVFRTTN
ncbi:MAG: bifunctional (p)ppGpp synthetase/guanosine-3',5'-bis(diphosphate) 3'-pyrophosphohydrolase [Clostridiales bacterium]|nr:bifunctional (p)ppGpp synthetase/guanosine-3',5'-bis(diphosphate) 3'-pyrophosphohydrolase [Clostridiales bacterium]